MHRTTGGQAGWPPTWEGNEHPPGVDREKHNQFYCRSWMVMVTWDWAVQTPTDCEFDRESGDLSACVDQLAVVDDSTPN